MLAPRRALVLVGLLLVAAGATARERPPRERARERKGKPARAKAEEKSRCKEPAPVDATLAAGLSAYAKADWVEAAKHLYTWAATPGAESDPAAARGLYSLSYAMRARGQAGKGAEYARRAKDLLLARADAQPSLEAYYYLSSAHQLLGDAPAQLEIVAKAIKEADEGALCPRPDADDTFRLARLVSAAGHGEREMELVRKASALYAQGKGEQAAYRALIEKALGDEARDKGDAAKAVEHYRTAAATDPSVGNVHRDLGFALIRQGMVREAAEYWGKNWTKERNDGNALMYAVPILGTVARHRERFGTEHVVDTSSYTTPALEQNAISEGKRVLELRAAAAGSEGGQSDELAIAEYRTGQFLLELLVRGADLPAFALQNGLLPVIHGRTLS